MTHRRLLVFGLVAVAALVAGGWVLRPRTAITRENAAKIQVGMTLAEAEAILGGPARDESSGPCELDATGAADGGFSLEIRRLHLMHLATIPGGVRWSSTHVLIGASVSEDGRDQRLTAINFVPMKRSEESFLDRIRRWLRP